MTTKKNDPAEISFVTYVRTCDQIAILLRLLTNDDYYLKMMVINIVKTYYIDYDFFGRYLFFVTHPVLLVDRCNLSKLYFQVTQLIVSKLKKYNQNYVVDKSKIIASFVRNLQLLFYFNGGSRAKGIVVAFLTNIILAREGSN